MDLVNRSEWHGGPLHFLDFSTETRLQIYSYLVVVGKVFYSPDDYTLENDGRFKDWKLFVKPRLQLFRVCRQIREEAEELYLSKNLFVLPDFFQFRDPINLDSLVPPGHLPFPDRPLFSNNAAKWLKNVSISFNSRFPTPHTFSRSRWDFLGDLNPARNFDSFSPAERLDDTHRYASAALTHAWIEALQQFVKFLGSKNPVGDEADYECGMSSEDEDDLYDHTLINLELDFTNTYCPFGCCRIDVHLRPLIGGTRPTNVTFRGLRNEEEKTVLLQRMKDDYTFEIEFKFDHVIAFRSTEGIIKKYNVKFDPEEDVWSKWKKAQRPRISRKI